MDEIFGKHSLPEPADCNWIDARPTGSQLNTGPLSLRLL